MVQYDHLLVDRLRPINKCQFEVVKLVLDEPTTLNWIFQQVFLPSINVLLYLHKRSNNVLMVVSLLFSIHTISKSRFFDALKVFWVELFHA